MLSRLRRTIEQYDLVSAGQRVLVAVSGGPDSTALLAALATLAPRLGISLCVAAVDHGFRPEAARETAQVARQAAALGLRCDILTVDVRAARARARGGWQDAARRVRLGALEDLAAERGCARIALGHQADDQAETILFRIVRGTGVKGLAGIPYRRGPFVRPMLDVRRREILRYLAKRAIPFAEDPSNADLRFARARVRHHLLPALAAENPRIVEALLSLAAEAAGHAKNFSEPADKPGPVPRRTGALIARLAARGAGTSFVDVPGGRVEIRYGVVHAAAPAAERPHPDDDVPQVVVDGPGAYKLGAGPVVVVDNTDDSGTVLRAWAAVFDGDRLLWPLALRRPRPGDRMRPRGGRGSRKLQDLLVDAKIPKSNRPHLPVVTDRDGDILFVAGVRPSETGRPGAATRRWVTIRAEGDESRL